MHDNLEQVAFPVVGKVYPGPGFEGAVDAAAEAISSWKTMRGASGQPAVG
jgi:hypothetical protein